MPITSQNIPAHEWIGLYVTITESSDPGLKGLAGIVRDETQNTILIAARGRVLTIPKAGTRFLTKLPTGQTTSILGSRLRFRPEDRVKKGLGRW